MTEKKRLYFGDNLDVLQRYVGDESVNVVYLGPPFSSAVNRDSRVNRDSYRLFCGSRAAC